MSSYAENFLYYFLFFAVIFILIIALVIVIIRWVFRINYIVSLLEQIAAGHKCDSYGLFFPLAQMSKIDSGQHICRDCLKK